ncbi:MAG: alpha/beta hydrolase [Phaeodactylibacter sp.]|nr:alpha/beta hydrolase [Phaeodactylibacter sp.]
MRALWILLIAPFVFLLSCEREAIDSPGQLVPATTDEDPDLPQLLVNGIPLHLETFGDLSKPILIFLHGGPGFDYKAMISQKGIENLSRYPDKRNHEAIGLAQLQNDYFCVFYDRRGSGLSPRFDPGMVKIEDQIEDLRSIIQYFKQQQLEATGVAGPVHLFGWSFGGYLATAFVNQYPELVDNLILYEARPFTTELLDLLTVTSPFQQLDEDYVDAVLSGYTYVLNTGHETADYQWAVGASGNFFPEFNNPDDLPFWRVGFLVNQEIEADIRKRNFDVISNLDAFQGKTLFLYGSKSEEEAIKPGYIETITGYFKQVVSQVIDQAGHFGPWDNPAAVIDAIRSFL